MPRILQNVTASCFDRRGRLLSVASNSYSKTHPLQKKYAARSGNADREYLHAELAALIKAVKRGKPYRLVVVRVGKNGQHMFSKPCDCCVQAIAAFGVKIVEHS